MSQPVTKFRDGTLEVAVWGNETDEGRIWYSISFERSYKDGDEWKKTTKLNADDALPVAHLLTKAHDAIIGLPKKSDAAE